MPTERPVVTIVGESFAADAPRVRQFQVRKALEQSGIRARPRIPALPYWFAFAAGLIAGLLL